MLLRGGIALIYRVSRRRKKSNPALVVAYLRASKDEQKLSPDAQREGIERWAAQHGLTVATWHSDHLSGSTPMGDRPGLLEALASLEHHKASALVVLRRCRLGRGQSIVIDIESEVLAKGARVLDTEAAPDAPDDESEMMRKGMWDLFNAVERKRIGRRTREALAVLKRQGVHLGGRPYGWNRQGEPIASEQAALLRMRELAANGNTQGEIVQTLTGEGHKPRGTQWNVTTVSRALRRA